MTTQADVVVWVEHFHTKQLNLWAERYTDMTSHLLQYAGYQNNGTTFSAGLKANLDYVDQSFARILAALNSSGNAATTGLVISAKHGQQPTNTNATLISPTPIATALKNQNIRCA